MCRKMCIDMCIDMCMHAHRHVCRHVPAEFALTQAAANLGLSEKIKISSKGNAFSALKAHDHRQPCGSIITRLSACLRVWMCLRHTK